MVIELTYGKIIVNMHELVVQLHTPARTTLQAQQEAITLIGNGANMLIANDFNCKWSIQLDNEEQIQQLSDHLSIVIS